MATLFIVATPIGNLGDISTRAIETLKNVELILAEDTRVTKKLLDRFQIETSLESYHQHSGEEKMYRILNFLMSGKDVALVTDAGTPGVSDPGNELVDFISRNFSKPSIQIIPIPGPSAVTAALSVCGFDVSQYMFVGFWPKKKASKYIKMLKDLEMPLVFFESPHRIVKTLDKLAGQLGERQVFVGRELTKMFELHYRGSLAEVSAQLKAEKNLRGEIVVVIQ